MGRTCFPTGFAVRSSRTGHLKNKYRAQRSNCTPGRRSERRQRRNLAPVCHVSFGATGEAYNKHTHHLATFTSIPISFICHLIHRHCFLSFSYNFVISVKIRTINNERQLHRHRQTERQLPCHLKSVQLLPRTMIRQQNLLPSPLRHRLHLLRSQLHKCANGYVRNLYLVVKH